MSDLSTVLHKIKIRQLSETHKQFDRIFKLCDKSIKRIILLRIFPILEVKFVGQYPTDFSKFNLQTKREILISIFTAQDKNYEFILKQGNLVNPSITELKWFWRKVRDKKLKETLLIYPATTYSALLSGTLPNLREVFCKNCIPIDCGSKENTELKLVKW